MKYEDRLTNPEQLLPGMLLILCSSFDGCESYIVESVAYKRTPEGEWFVQLSHEGGDGCWREYRLHDLGITLDDPDIWTCTEVALKVQV